MPTSRRPAKATRTDYVPRYFDPASRPGARRLAEGRIAVGTPEAQTYVYAPKVVLAVNAALATERPLLVTGEPGTGKTALAAHVASVLQWRYYERVVTSRTRARDLMWRFDQIKRLSSANEGKGLPPRAAHIEPREMWWAFEPASAAWRGAPHGAREGVPAASDPVRFGSGPKAVLLIDEIDKAEPDVPNDLLEALDRECFDVDDLESPLRVQGKRQQLLLVLTTNRERELPAAFLRRCVVLDLDLPKEAWLGWLQTVAAEHAGASHAALAAKVAEEVVKLRNATPPGQRRPGTAEFLDAFKACRQLRLSPSSRQWEDLADALLAKRIAGAEETGQA